MADPELAEPPRRLLLQWHITERCNRSCRHCYQERSGTAGELGFEQLCEALRGFLSLADEFEARSGGRRRPIHVTVTGGEPFVRDDFLDLLDYLAAHRRRLSFAILTNGSLIDGRVARFLRSVRPSFVQVSIDGGPETHDALRGPGDHGRVCEAVRRLADQGVPAMVSFTASRLNYREFPEVAATGRKIGANAVWTDRLVPIGGGAAMADLALSVAETREYAAIVAAEARRHPAGKGRRFAVLAHRALQFLEAGGPAYACGAGRSLLTLLPDGTLTPCRRMPIPVGSILRSGFADLYWNSPILRDLRSSVAAPAGCGACPDGERCRGGLRCLAYALHGDQAHADPGCWMARQPAASKGAPPRDQGAHSPMAEK